MTKSLLDDVIDTLQSGPPKVGTQAVAIGDTIPAFGYITSILEETDTSIVLQLNHYMHVILASNPESNKLLRERSLEPGVFLGKVESLEPITLRCHAVVFGNKKEEVEQ